MYMREYIVYKIKLKLCERKAMNPKKSRNVVVIFILVFAILVGLASRFIEENKYNASVRTETIVVKPEKIETIDTATNIQYLKIENIDESNNTLLFYTDHKEVFVYVEDELIYSLEKEDSIFGRTSGAMWNIISLPFDTKEVKVELTSVYPNLTAQEVEFLLGSAITMQREVVLDSIVDVIICLSILLIGVSLLIFWILVFRKLNIQKEILYLGLFSIVFGIWTFGETKLAVFMFENRAFWSYLAFTCLMVMGLPFLYFVKEFMETEDKYLHKWIAGYIIIETIAAQFLHLTGIASVKETAMFTMTNIIFTIGYLFYGILTAIKKKKSKRRIIANILGLLALLLSTIADMGGYFRNVSESNQLSKLGFLVYAVILGIETARVAQERMQEAHKMEIYREMAEMDMPTGCYNRNAYSEDISVEMELTGVHIITFDLNNLKHCNDTKGHMAGDKYIADAAHLIQEVFQGLGKVYRIGGDEFCIVAKGITENTILERRDALKKAIYEYREKNFQDEFGISCGYAIYDPEIDRDIEETRHRADLSMYENKKEIKTTK